MILVDGASGWWLGHKGEALLHGIRAFINEALGCLLSPSRMWGHNERSLTKEGRRLTMLETWYGIWASRTVRNELFLFINYAVLWNFVIAPQWTEIKRDWKATSRWLSLDRISEGEYDGKDILGHFVNSNS